MTIARTDQVAHVGDVVRRWLDELVATNQNFAGYGLPVTVYGPEDDAADTSPPGIHWCPLTESFMPPQRQGAPGSPGMLLVRSVPVSFVLFGGVPPEGTFTESGMAYQGTRLTETLMSKLMNIIHRTSTPQSYAIGSATWFNSGRTGIGMSLELVVEVRVPLIREDNPTAHITKATVRTEFAPHV